MRIFLATFFAAVLISPTIEAKVIEYPELEAFARKAMTLCPGESQIKIEPIDQIGPTGFKSYQITLTSGDEHCREVTYSMVSEKTNNILFAAVFVLPSDQRTLNQKIVDTAERTLRKRPTVVISATPLPDGLKQVIMTLNTPEGPLRTRGYVDASEVFFMVGRLMNIKKDPREQYLSMLGASTGAKRGASMSRVQVLEISDLQCPSCQSAHLQMEKFLARYGDRIGYTRIDLPFYENHDWTLRASLAARALYKSAPTVYWSYVDFVFKNQESLAATAIDKTIKDFMQDHDVDYSKIERFMKDPNEKRALLDQVGRLYDADIFATPTILINGQKVFWSRDSTFHMDYIEQLLGIDSKGSK